jgi:hypothetical protein
VKLVLFIAGKNAYLIVALRLDLDQDSRPAVDGATDEK